MAFIVFSLFFVGALFVALWLKGKESKVELASKLRGVFLGIAGLFGLLMLSCMIVVIDAGHIGVVDVFGNVSPNTLKSGIQFVNPMARVVQMSIQTQEIKEVMEVPSKEGMTMSLEMSVLYHLDPEKAADVYRSVGETFAAVLIEPQFRSVARGVTASYEAKALYTSEREAVAQLITVDLQKIVGPRGVIIENTPLRKLTLPARLQAAIEEKLSADQESQRMQFVLTKEKQEADRKRIEAQGIADFQTIVTLGISDKLLQWKGIEATQDLAKSQNAKIVIIGNSKNGLPLVLGDVK
jgi:regulator of protease activity HflC (stomatin/prohibitin superfamily)